MSTRLTSLQWQHADVSQVTHIFWGEPGSLLGTTEADGIIMTFAGIFDRKAKC